MQVYIRPKKILLGSSLTFNLKEGPVRCAKVCDKSWVILLDCLGFKDRQICWMDKVHFVEKVNKVVSIAVWKNIHINGTNPDSQQLPTYWLLLPWYIVQGHQIFTLKPSHLFREVDLQQLESTFFKNTVGMYRSVLKSKKHLATFSDAGTGGPWGPLVPTNK